MALFRKLREDTMKRLRVGQAAYYNHVRQKFVESGAPSMDVAALLLAQELGIDVTKRRYAIPEKKLQALQDYRSRQGMTIVSVPAESTPKARKRLTQKNLPFKKLLKFEGKYPDLFFDKLERELNIAYSNPDLPNAVIMLSRKLIENLVYRAMQMQFHGKDIKLYFDSRGRALDFSILLDNMKNHKQDFPSDLQNTIDKFLVYATSFRKKANANTHEVIEYLEKMSEVKDYKIEEMVALLLNLIKAVS